MRASSAVNPVIIQLSNTFAGSIENTRVQVLTEAWSRYAIKTLPRVWLYIHVKRTARLTVDIKKPTGDSPAWEEPVRVKKSGRWKEVHITPRIRLEVNAVYFAWSLGRAKPRQASSSPLIIPVITYSPKIFKINTIRLEYGGKSFERIGKEGDSPNKL